jgi:hypothetical protein
MIIDLHIRISGEGENLIIDWGSSYRTHLLTEVNENLNKKITEVLENAKAEIQEGAKQEGYQVEQRTVQMILRPDYHSS